jgi:DNA-binding response OmpR family regulator
MPIEPHILFVDDNPDICELVQLVLQAGGFRVSTADNTAAALQLVASERFDALLLDYWMPDSTGIELCRRIRAFDQTTPILICSGAMTQADKEAAVLAGAQGYVNKPFYSGDLIRAVRSSLQSTHLETMLPT